MTPLLIFVVVSSSPQSLITAEVCKLTPCSPADNVGLKKTLVYILALKLMSIGCVKICTFLLMMSEWVIYEFVPDRFLEDIGDSETNFEEL